MSGAVSLPKHPPRVVVTFTRLHVLCLYCSVFEERLFFLVVSGRIDASEIQQSLAELGMDISRQNALKILQRFDLHFYLL